LSGRALDIRLSIDQLYDEINDIQKSWCHEIFLSEQLADITNKLTNFQFQEELELHQDKVNELKIYLENVIARVPQLKNLAIEERLKSLLDASTPELFADESSTSLIFTDLLEMEIQSILVAKSQRYFNFADLDKVHNHNSHLLAKLFIEAFEKKQEINLDTWQIQYQKDIINSITRQLSSIAGREWQKPSEVDHISMLDSLSYLFLQNQTVETARNFINRYADTHAFIQSTGFSSKTDNTFMAILDFYNYGRYQEDIAEHRKILESILSPFSPIYYEYKNIANSKNTSLTKVLRIIMPMIIIAAFTIFIGALLSTLAIAESAFLVALIPTLYIGTYLSSLYVSYKDKFLHDYNVIKHGGEFEIPEYQISQRMITTFGSQERAESIRKIYINEIQRCDKIEEELRPHALAGELDSANIKLRHENIKLRYSILLEWYDIHSNVDLGIETVPQIVQNRLQGIECREMEKAKVEIESNTAEQLKILTENYIQHVSSLMSPNKPREDIDAEPSPRINSPQSPNSSHRFFKPNKVLQHQKIANSVHTITEELRGLEQSPVVTI